MSNPIQEELKSEKLSKIASELYEILGQPVAVRILEQLTEKQIWRISDMIENILKPNEHAFYYQNEEDSLTNILSILDYGKSKLNSRFYSGKTARHLKDKKII
jgi:uncharacterized protein YcgL (UPF0745 family)